MRIRDQLRPICMVLPLLMLVPTGSVTAEEPAAKLPAFPGAEGFGAYAAGGRGGQILFVTTTEDYHPAQEKPIPGSLRAAVETEGPRIIIFRVSGTIRLKDRLRISHPYITVAGNTAPGDGITIADAMTRVQTHDVIVRHVRFRLGDASGNPDDCVWIAHSRDVIFDHCSATWGIDENFSVTGDCDNITVQWCLIAEALHESLHGKGNHGYGSLLRLERGNLSLHHNVYAHNRSRNPRPGGYGESPGPLLDFRNNLVYNWGDRAGYNASRAIRINYINNYFKPGPQTTDANHAFSIGGEATRFHAAGNFMEGNEPASHDNWLMIRTKHREANQADGPFPAAEVKTHDAREAYKSVLMDVGATRPRRDPVDERIIRSIRDGTGRHIDSQTEVGGWPELASAEAPIDSSGDGMPDAWKLKYGLDPNKFEAHEDLSGDGYTNIEAYIHDFDPRQRQR